MTGIRARAGSPRMASSTANPSSSGITRSSSTTSMPGAVVAQQVQRDPPVLRLDHLVAEPAEQAPERLPVQQAVVDDQDPPGADGGHGRRRSLTRPSARRARRRGQPRPGRARLGRRPRPPRHRRCRHAGARSSSERAIAASPIGADRGRVALERVRRDARPAPHRRPRPRRRSQRGSPAPRRGRCRRSWSMNVGSSPTASSSSASTAVSSVSAIDGSRRDDRRRGPRSAAASSSGRIGLLR